MSVLSSQGTTRNRRRRRRDRSGSAVRRRSLDNLRIPAQHDLMPVCSATSSGGRRLFRLLSASIVLPGAAVEAVSLLDLHVKRKSGRDVVDSGISAVGGTASSSGHAHVRESNQQAALHSIIAAGGEEDDSKKVKQPTIKGFVYPYYGPQAFSDKAHPHNPWVRNAGMSPVAADMDVEAPMDRLHPSDKGPDILGKNHEPYSDFPLEQESAICRNAMETELANRVVVAPKDDFPGSGMENSNFYPLQSPYDTVKLPVVASMDRINQGYARFLNQLRAREKVRQQGVDRVTGFKSADNNNDQMITYSEFEAILKNQFGKATDETQELWNEHKVVGGSTMTPTSFMKLYSTGFDTNLHSRNRADFRSSLTLNCPVRVGQWGNLALCPVGKPVTEVRIKRKASVENSDNQGLTGIELKCADGSTLLTSSATTAENDETGVWSDWNKCSNENLKISGFRARNQVFQPQLTDNSAVNDVSLLCRAHSVHHATPQANVVTLPDEELRFGETSAATPAPPPDSTAPVQSFKVAGFGAGEEPQVNEGGWSNKKYCRTEHAQLKTASSSEVICGFQTRSGTLGGAGGEDENNGGPEDKLGITDIRFFCCEDYTSTTTGFFLMEKP